MKNETPTERTCPKCGCVYTRVPALSRTDNKTLICPDCGIRELSKALVFPNKNRKNPSALFTVTQQNNQIQATMFGCVAIQGFPP